MMLDTTPPKVFYEPNEPVLITYKNQQLQGFIKGEPYENQFGIMCYDVMVEAERIPRVHYLIKKFQ